MLDDMPDIMRVLHSIDQGDPQAATELLPLVYEELRQLAAAKMAAERDDHTLQATALVHEAYLRLVGSNNSSEWNSRGHFFAAAAEAMRRTLIDHARNARALKRGGGIQQLSIDALDLIWKPRYGDILELDDALNRLEPVDSQAAQLVKLRCFAAQTQAEAAALMGISLSTAKRCWSFARAWLHRDLKHGDSTP